MVLLKGPRAVRFLVSEDPCTLYEDNRACQLMSEPPTHRERSKHTELRVHGTSQERRRSTLRVPHRVQDG